MRVLTCDHGRHARSFPGRSGKFAPALYPCCEGTPLPPQPQQVVRDHKSLRHAREISHRCVVIYTHPASTGDLRSHIRDSTAAQPRWAPAAKNEPTVKDKKSADPTAASKSSTTIGDVPQKCDFPQTRTAERALNSSKTLRPREPPRRTLRQDLAEQAESLAAVRRPPITDPRLRAQNRQCEDVDA